MPKIIVSLADTEEQETVCAALRLKKHDVAVMDPIAPEENPKDVSRKFLEEKAAVIVMDYLDTDAMSVKILQASTDAARLPRYIFILPDGIPQSHVLMAVNEGAAAILERPVNMEALGNYIERAISGPSRFRREMDEQDTLVQDLADMERETKAMRRQLASNRKLVSFLMSTPSADQHRTALIVSDSAYQRDHLKKLLEDHGFLISEAKDPESGIQVALDEKPRIVISDLEMEGKNGIEFCNDLKIVHKFMPCFFVICTANQEKIDEIMVPGNGVDACVIKPSSERGNAELVATAAMGLLL